ncbi:hypothetical protein HY375_00195 [Candidatus Berkelbacteria bacterium]|nr:hypothetical protein [Candidatus Berkelbacteria bacterium]
MAAAFDSLPATESGQTDDEITGLPAFCLFLHGIAERHDEQVRAGRAQAWTAWTLPQEGS